MPLTKFFVGKSIADVPALCVSFQSWRKVSASTDGASDLRILWEIIIPMCLPGIITAAVIASVFAMNEYFLTLIIGRREAYTMSIALANFKGGSDGIIYNVIALIAFMAFFPIPALVISIQNHLSRGLTMGAVKG